MPKLNCRTLFHKNHFWSHFSQKCSTDLHTCCIFQNCIHFIFLMNVHEWQKIMSIVRLFVICRTFYAMDVSLWYWNLREKFWFCLLYWQIHWKGSELKFRFDWHPVWISAEFIIMSHIMWLRACFFIITDTLGQPHSSLNSLFNRFCFFPNIQP